MTERDEKTARQALSGDLSPSAWGREARPRAPSAPGVSLWPIAEPGAAAPADWMRRWALYLDVDGTLLDIATTPGGVQVPDGLVATLAHLAHALDGALAIVTGRRLVEIDRLLAPLKLTGAGVHGGEMRLAADQPVERLARAFPSSLLADIERVSRMTRGIIVELKDSSVAVHYRNAPDAGPAIEQALERLLDGGPLGLVLCSGRKVVEVMPAHVSKGAALRYLSELPVFAGRRPIMIGDDVSDETALAAARTLGGFGLQVAGGCFTRDAARFSGPADVLAWLKALAASVPR